MESPPKFKFKLIFFIIISLSFGLISFISCIAGEVKRTKKEDLKWNGKYCYLPPSQAFETGVAALVSLSVAQIIGNSIFFQNSCSERKRNAQYKIPIIAKVLFLISWVSFAIVVILLIPATSMSRKQPYGEGWLNGECYLVRGEPYVGSAILILITIGSIIGSALSTVKTNQADQGPKIHAQLV